MANLNFGHTTPADRMRAHTSHAIRSTMLDVTSNLPLLLEVVANGPTTWRNRFLHECRGLAVNEAIADSMFAFFCTAVQQRYGRTPVHELLDALEVTAPPTQAEIDAAWEVESASSEEGRRYFYGPDGHPEDLIKRMVS